MTPRFIPTVFGLVMAIFAVGHIENDILVALIEIVIALFSLWWATR